MLSSSSITTSRTLLYCPCMLKLLRARNRSYRDAAHRRNARFNKQYSANRALWNDYTIFTLLPILFGHHRLLLGFRNLYTEIGNRLMFLPQVIVLQSTMFCSIRQNSFATTVIALHEQLPQQHAAESGVISSWFGRVEHMLELQHKKKPEFRREIAGPQLL